jgi:hypothetical protein
MSKSPHSIDEPNNRGDSKRGSSSFNEVFDLCEEAHALATWFRFQWYDQILVTGSYILYVIQ